MRIVLQKYPHPARLLIRALQPLALGTGLALLLWCSLSLHAIHADLRAIHSQQLAAAMLQLTTEARQIQAEAQRAIAEGLPYIQARPVTAPTADGE